MKKKNNISKGTLKKVLAYVRPYYLGLLANDILILRNIILLRKGRLINNKIDVKNKFLSFVEMIFLSVLLKSNIFEKGLDF